MSDNENRSPRIVKNKNQRNLETALSRERIYEWYLSLFVFIIITVFMVANDPSRRNERVHRRVITYLLLFLLSFKVITVFLDTESQFWYIIRFDDMNVEMVPRYVRITTSIAVSLVAAAILSAVVDLIYANLYKKGSLNF